MARFAPDRARALILTVDPATRRIDAGIRDGGVIQVSVTDDGPMFRWPIEGEQWTIYRRNNAWHLDSLLEPPHEDFLSIEELLPGETRLASETIRNRAGEKLLTEQTELFIPAVPGMTLPWPSTNLPPERFLLCDGAAYSRTTYAALFAIIGTLHGVGNGTTTFNVPNYVNKFLKGAGVVAVGGAGGVDSNTLNGSHLPQHSHGAGTLVTDGAPNHNHGRGDMTVTGRANKSATGSTGANRLSSLQGSAPSDDLATWDVNGSTSNAGAHSHNVQGVTSPTGGLSPTALDNNPPFAATNWMIYAGV